MIIAGAGPAGATSAAFCAQAGLKALVLEKALFPRDKVCGDCLNPVCWPILERLGLAERLLERPHSQLAEVEFIGLDGRSLSIPLTPSDRGESAIKRADFDQLLLERARECGAEVRQNCTITKIELGWKIHTDAAIFSARVLIAADGRNSTVARLLGLLPAAKKDRVALQTHVAAPPDFGQRVVLRFLPEGYCGVASVGAGELNLCLVSRPAQSGALKAWAEKNFAIPLDHVWRSVAPLARRAVAPAHENLFLVGDAARVVEPFTGEGIYYALASGELAARHLVQQRSFREYRRAHARLYRGRLWVNLIAKQAVLRPQLGSLALGALRFYPPALRFLTAKVVGGALR